jgi:hypothetical protein
MRVRYGLRYHANRSFAISGVVITWLMAKGMSTGPSKQPGSNHVEKAGNQMMALPIPSPDLGIS